jgi:uncharacterized protein YndB with AHSA1/START domain
MRIVTVVALTAVLLGGIARSRAEVLWSAPTGFEVRETVHVAAAPARAFDDFIAHVGDWWSDDHTWSGSAKNMSIQNFPGGCFCEKLKDGGGVEHLRVVSLRPGAAISLAGGLGPLQALAFQGVMRVTFIAAGTGADVTLTYRVQGADPKGAASMAAPVDGMLGETLQRYQRYSDTGSPELKH